MNVALDARKLFDGGIGTYIRGVLGALARDVRGDAFTALVDPRDAGRVAWPGPVAERTASAGKYGLSEHWVVPREARAAGAKVLHAPHYTLPLLWNGPAVVTIHDLIHLRFPQFHPPGAALYARVVAGAAVARARVVLADSEFTREDVIELLGANPDQVRVAYLAAPEGLAAPPPGAVAAFRAARGLPADYVLYVGARKRHKNLGLLLRAWAAMRGSERPPLVLSGAPWPADDRHAHLAAALGVAKHVHFAGESRDDGSLAALYAGAALYAHPALCEGFGLPPLEAMACGTPVLSSDAGSLPEVVGDAAQLLPPRDPAAWAHAITSLLGSPSRRDGLVARGRERVKRFSWAKTAEAARAAYHAAAAE
ncbi:MAG: glycosyltransferase family 4 protein [Candidatus Eisenbacteria bacterium]|nr:glycosyltransferase family 4 protein [Candidatus Eisenbacteria bacterium]